MVGNIVSFYVAAVDDYRLIFPLHFAPKMAQNVDSRIHVLKVGTVMDYIFTRIDEGCGKNGKHAVFRPVGAHRARKTGTSFYDKSAHISPLLSIYMAYYVREVKYVNYFK